MLLCIVDLFCAAFFETNQQKILLLSLDGCIFEFMHPIFHCEFFQSDSGKDSRVFYGKQRERKSGIARGNKCGTE